MSRRMWFLPAVSIAGLGVVVGCGSGTGLDGTPLQPMGRIIEYVGDGGGSLKPWPPFLPPKPSDDAFVVGTLLGPYQWAIEGTVPRKQTNWFRLPSRSAPMTMVVTLQPTANEDSDLYLLEASDYGDGAAVLAYSIRTPDGGQPDPASGYAPDWVPLTAGPTSGYPAANVAVFGLPDAPMPSPKHFQIEMDIPSAMTVNGPALTHGIHQHQSRWYSYTYTGGAYTVTVTPMTGDPDFYVYRENATMYLGGQVGPGGGSVPLEAYVPAPRFIRVYGFTTGRYTIRITAP